MTPRSWSNIWESDAVDRKRWERAVRAYEQAYPLRHSTSEAKSDGALADQLKALGVRRRLGPAHQQPLGPA